MCHIFIPLSYIPYLKIIWKYIGYNFTSNLARMSRFFLHIHTDLTPTCSRGSQLRPLDSFSRQILIQTGSNRYRYSFVHLSFCHVSSSSVYLLFHAIFLTRRTKDRNTSRFAPVRLSRTTTCFTQILWRNLNFIKHKPKRNVSIDIQFIFYFMERQFNNLIVEITKGALILKFSTDKYLLLNQEWRVQLRLFS